MDQFQTYAVADPCPVPNAGQLVWAAFLQEQLAPPVEAAYLQSIASVLVAGESNVDLNMGCCSWHQNQYDLFRRSLNKNRSLPHPQHPWLLEFLDAVCAFSPATRVQLRVKFKSIKNKRKLSFRRMTRLMPLNLFIETHVIDPRVLTRDLSLWDAIEQDFAATRRSDIRRAKLKAWHRRNLLRGQVGSYANNIGVFSQSRDWCPSIAPFATDASGVDSMDRTGSPDDFLIQAGMRFRPGEKYVELQYRSSQCAIVGHDREQYLGIPAIPDAGSNWLFRPDRDWPGPTCNFTRRLSDNKRGLPEVIHRSLEIIRLDELIVWGQPTRSNWCHFSIEPLS